MLYEAAISLIGKNAEFREIHNYYRTRKENHLKKMQSVVAVACKVLRIFYTILTKGVDYDRGEAHGGYPKAAGTGGIGRDQRDSSTATTKQTALPRLNRVLEPLIQGSDSAGRDGKCPGKTFTARCREGRHT